MFTGIIEEVGTVAELTTDPTGGHLRIECSKLLPRLEVSSSVSVSGCCLTVTRRDDTGFWCDLAPETLNRTGFRRLQAGAQVNLEVPLTPSTPLGGHIVQGHVDGTGEFLGLPEAGEENFWLDVKVPPELTRYLVEKGSVAVEGISLTVAAIEGAHLRIAIIPFTIEHTNLRTLHSGDPVNLECDVLAKYLEKLMTERALSAPAAEPAPALAEKAPASRITLERLLDEGF
jgi:riboflavin synthase